MGIYNRAFYNSVTSRARATANVVASETKGLVEIKSLIDVGCGQGVWSKAFMLNYPNLEKVTMVDLDSARITELAELETCKTKIEYVSLDLNRNKLSLGSFDLGICVEVLEHLSHEAALSVIGYLSESCRVLVFSAALKGQGGTGHINEQSFDFWTELLRKYNFAPIDLYRHKLRDHTRFPTYYSNSIALWINVKLDGLELIDIDSLITDTTLPFWDVRSCIVKSRYWFLSYMPPWVITKLSKIYNWIRKISFRHNS